MAYGGGSWFTQNKILPGAYVKFSSIAKASTTISDRGVAAAPFALSWGEEGVVRLIEQGDFLKDCFELFGFSYSAPEMVHLREIFLHATKVFCYRLSSAGSQKAKDETGFVSAKYTGKRGNDIRVVITTDPTTNKYIVVTKVGTRDADKQIVAKWGDLEDTDWVTWTKTTSESKPTGEYFLTADETPDARKEYYERTGEEGAYTYTKVNTPDSLSMGSYYEKEMANIPLTIIFEGEVATTDPAYDTAKEVPLEGGGATLVLSGGDDGEIDGKSYDDFLDAIEECSFNTLCCPVWVDPEKTVYEEGETDPRVIVNQFVSFTKRMRDDVGAYFQLVAHKPGGADHEGVIGLWNDIDIGNSRILTPASLAYWLTGAEAGCNIFETLTNTKYNGELNILVDTKQSKLEEHIEKGHLVFHRSHGDIVVLTDIDSLMTLKEHFGEDFQANQTMRVCDQIANDVTLKFDRRYLGNVQNDKAGRGTLWNDVVEYLRELERLRAIESFDPKKVKCELGKTKKSVLLTIDELYVVNAMEKLYMAVIIQ